MPAAHLLSHWLLSCLLCAVSLPRPRNAYNLFTVDMVARKRAQTGAGETLVRISGACGTHGLLWRGVHAPTCVWVVALFVCVAAGPGVHAGVPSPRLAPTLLPIFHASPGPELWRMVPPAEKQKYKLAAMEVGPRLLRCTCWLAGRVVA